MQTTDRVDLIDMGGTTVSIGRVDGELFVGSFCRVDEGFAKGAGEALTPEKIAALRDLLNDRCDAVGGAF